MEKKLTPEEQSFLDKKFPESKKKTSRMITLSENIVVNGNVILRKGMKVSIEEKK
jgi:hypothetical protein